MTTSQKKKYQMKGRPRGGASVPCPQCGKDSHVVVTRRVDDGVERKRECKAKRPHSFRTLELPT